MNNLFSYLLELNISLIILFLAYRLFFEKDKNFNLRRIYLLVAMLLPLLLPLIPDFISLPGRPLSTVSFKLEEVTVFGTRQETAALGSLSLAGLLLALYIAVFSLGILKVLLQLGYILAAILRSDRFNAQGITLLASKSLHASSFFRYIFIDPETGGSDSFKHILEHENTHKREWHSVDRILVELFVIVNWFNPVAWMFRRSVIENLEYLADSAVLKTGTDPVNYQLSILNQYIGSASISNQFSSQIKNRINMLNKNYKFGSRWKLALLLPLSVIAFLIGSCTDKDVPIDSPEAIEATDDVSANVAGDEVFFVVDQMPTFKGEEAIEFRRYIAQNLIYPTEASANGVTGKIFIKFIVDKEGKVVIPDQESLAKIEGKPLGEVVVAAYRSLEEDAEMPEEKYIELLKQEVIRVVSSSPDWEPGRQGGQAVSVMYTFPVNFVLQ
jgi:hypothetical protein